MRVFILALFLLVATVDLSLETVIGYGKPEQELLIYQQRVIVVNELLKSECPNMVETRALVPTIPLHIDVEKDLYNRLITKLSECRASKVERMTTAKLLTTTVPTLTTTKPPTTTMPPTTTESPTTTTELSTTTTVLTTTTAPIYKDCQEYYEKGYRKSGVYNIDPPSSKLPPFNVWCDFINNHGWTVIQRRGNRSVSFDRDWNAYKIGFGDIDGEHWIGNERIYRLTQTNQKLNIRLTRDKDDVVGEGVWQTFYITDESDQYRLYVSTSGNSGNLIGGFTYGGSSSGAYHNGMKFSTADRDNDKHAGNCAAGRKDGWWYNACDAVRLNGFGSYMRWVTASSYTGVSLTSSVMRVTRG